MSSIKPLRGQRNQCGACREYFARNSGHAKHRVGSFSEDTRRCLSVPEMEARGFTRAAGGFWRMPSRGENPWSKTKESE